MPGARLCLGACLAVALVCAGCANGPPIAIKSTADALLAAKAKVADKAHDKAQAIKIDAIARCAGQPEGQVRPCRHEIADKQLDALDAQVDKLRVGLHLAADALNAASVTYEAVNKGALPKAAVATAVAALLGRWQDFLSLYGLIFGGAP